MFRLITYILAIIAFNKLIVCQYEWIKGYYSEPDLSHTFIDKELLDSCGLRYGVLDFTIKYNKKCFLNESNVERVIAIPVLRGFKSRERSKPTTRVMGPTSRPVKHREAPWVVQIASMDFTWYGELKSINHWCTGVLITMKYILTAAHCLGYDMRAAIYVRSDHHRTGWSTTEFLPFLHPNWTTGRIDSEGKPIYDSDYDIGIIELRKPIDWHKYGKDMNGMYLINTICLPTPEDFSDPEFADRYDIFRKATGFGWGLISEGVYPDTLRRGDYLVKYTNDWIEKFNTPWVLNLTNICDGDSGSGLVQYVDELESRAVLIGIFSTSKTVMGKDCTPEFGINSIAVRVVHYLDWINSFLEKR